MKRVSKRFVIFLAAVALVETACTCSASALGRLWGEFETDFRTVSSRDENETGVHEVEMRLNYQASKNSTLFVNVEREEDENEIKEAYLDTKRKGLAVRAGKFRTPFGIHQPAEIDYFGFINRPIAKDAPAAGMSLSRASNGVRFSTGKPEMEIQLSILDGTEEMNSAVGRNVLFRAQRYAGHLITGFNAYQGHNADAQRFNVWGVDWRYSKPHLIVRGEALKGSLGPDRLQGGYVDVFYHFATIPALTLFARMEALSENSTRAVTGGCKYVLSRKSTLNVNWRRISSSGAESSEVAVQLLTFYGF
ncbi:MAG: porin [Armatimonadota bacterium]|nr:porin [Armatimonadota bacterium]